MEESLFMDLRVLSHRDVWKNNLMFKFTDNYLQTPTNCVLIDFQTARFLPVTLDVLMAIICNTRRGHYEKFLDYYLKFYYRELENELEQFKIDLQKKMTFEAFMKTVDHHKSVILVYNAVFEMYTLIPNNFFMLLGEKRFQDFSYGDRTKYILAIMEQDDFYRQCVMEAVEAVVEHFSNDP